MTDRKISGDMFSRGKAKLDVNPPRIAAASFKSMPFRFARFIGYP
jgi:hypothetical protein